jgi:hypothetical protein
LRLFTFSECNHMFCKECLSNYWSSQKNSIMEEVIQTGKVLCIKLHCGRQEHLLVLEKFLGTTEMSEILGFPFEPSKKSLILDQSFQPLYPSSKPDKSLEKNSKTTDKDKEECRECNKKLEIRCIDVKNKINQLMCTSCIKLYCQKCLKELSSSKLECTFCERKIATGKSEQKSDSKGIHTFPTKKNTEISARNVEAKSTKYSTQPCIVCSISYKPCFLLSCHYCKKQFCRSCFQQTFIEKEARCPLCFYR